MLTSLRMKNYTSFKNDTILDLKSTGYKILERSNVHEQVLKGLFFVGPNASGKTNVIRALRLLLELLFAEKIVNLSSNVCLFSVEHSFLLEYTFEIGQAVIEYQIEFDTQQRKFLVEKLTVDQEEVLNRVGSNGETKLTDARLYSNIDDYSLLLREIYYNTKFRAHETLKKWFEFLLNSVYVDGHERVLFSPGKHGLRLNEYVQSEAGVQTINQFFTDYHFDQRIEYSNSSEGPLNRMDNGEEKRIFFKREGIGEPIPYWMESLGNRNLLNLLPAFFHVVQRGGMLIIDEFSSGLHNFLEELLIRYFMKASTNAQIFIVSHSTNLLTNALLRPDQIYAVNFWGKEGSGLKLFSSEKPREAQNLERMYLNGVFGGVPEYNDEDLA
ncbi:AAA family ATPase [Tumebacillus flagellatus]|uniref:ATPase n=1 Tax=Tumebacillus flagellatus TaxID=1157490 RepID=A0A074LVG1_9BACL|nr:AAA family ATPase [Tumebacillus flagellatus]KEO83993.1 ATPase [Tumebacillus flagellatus]